MDKITKEYYELVSAIDSLPFSMQRAVLRYKRMLSPEYLVRWKKLLDRGNVPILCEAMFPDGEKEIEKPALRWLSVHGTAQWYYLAMDDLEYVHPDEATIWFVGRRAEAVTWAPQWAAKFPSDTGPCVVLQVWLRWGRDQDPVFIVPFTVIPAEEGRLHHPKLYLHPSLQEREIRVEEDKNYNPALWPTHQQKLEHHLRYFEALDRLAA